MLGRHHSGRHSAACARFDRMRPQARAGPLRSEDVLRTDPVAHSLKHSENVLLAAAGEHALGGSLVRLGRGAPLFTENVVWFPLDAVIRSVTSSGILEDWTDCQGAVGLTELLSGASSGSLQSVEREGFALSAPQAWVSDLLGQSPAFNRAVMAWLVGREQTARQRACFNLTASAADKVRLVIERLLKLHEGHAAVTQEQIAALLNMRRPTVCGVMRTLQVSGQIKYSRGRLCRGEMSSGA